MKRPIAMLSTALVAVALSGFAVTAAAAEDAPPPEVIEVIETPITEPESIVLEEIPPVEDTVQPLAAAASFSVTWVTICHKPGTPAEQETKDVPEAAVEGHLGHGDHLGACLVEADTTPYVLVAWTLPNDLPGPIWPGQLIKTSIDLESGDLNALDDQLTQCGVDYQVDLYHDSEITAALIAGGVLNGPSDPAEDLAYDGVKDGNPWKYIDNADCEVPPPPTNVICETYTDGGTATNLDANGWVPFDTRPAGHAEYVEGGLHIYTDDASSNAKIQWAKDITDIPLSQVGQFGHDYDADYGLLPGVKVNVTFAPGLAGTLIWETVYDVAGEQDLWLPESANAGIIAPDNGGGYGSTRHGTVNEWLTAYPDAVVNAIQFGIGSGAYGGGVLHSVTVGCAIYSFDHENQVVPVPALFEAEPTDPTCEVDGSFDFTGEFPNVTVTVTPEPGSPVAPGVYTVAADANAGYEFSDGTTHKEVEITVEGAIGYQSVNSGAPCYQAPPEEPEEPVVPPALALTGADTTLTTALAFGGVGVIALGFIALLVMVIRARRNNPVEH